MSANFYAWPPSLNLDPKARDFSERIDAFHLEAASPHPALEAFVAALLERYPDGTTIADSVWTDSPLQEDIAGEFLNVGVRWKRSDEVWTFFRETAKAHGLVCYDPQSEKAYMP